MDTSAGFSFLLIGFFVLGFLAFGVALFGFWVWMLVDCATHTPDENNQKLIWILVIVLTGFIGAFIYLLVQRPKNRVREGFRPT